MKLSKIALATAATLLSGAAFADFVPLPVGVGILEDDNIEYVLDSTGAFKTSGTLAVGDRLRAVVKFSNVLNPDNSVFAALGAPGLELTGISEIEVKSINAVTGLYTFGTSAAFTSVYGAGAMAAMFAQTTGDFFTSCNGTSIAACETAATNGTKWAVAGLSDADDFWVASSAIAGVPLNSIDVSTLAGSAATTKVAVANFALSILYNGTGYEFNEQNSALSPFYTVGGDGKTDVIGSGDILGGQGLSNNYVARSDFDFQVSRVPEPTSMSLIGLGLLGLGALSRKRKAS